MKLIKNKLTDKQVSLLPSLIQKFHKDSKSEFRENKFVLNTIKNIILGIDQKALHDLWLSEDNKTYCLCRVDIDSDGEIVYTAYQLWVDPSVSQENRHKKIVNFLRFYSQKHKIKRLYIISSRMDKIQAYQRGIGYSFKPKYLTFVENY